MEKIRVENLYKIFGNNPKKIIPMLKQGASKDEIMEKTKHGVGVNNASFGVKEGEIVVVMGLSGSGKSTLVRCINRLIDPTGGKIFIDGEDITTLSKSKLRKIRLEKLGMVFQNFALFPHRTVLKNTEYGLEIADTPPATRRQKAMEALELVGLSGWEQSFPDQLSGGMRQRVGLARALALDPDILLMDEAFSALDPLIRRDMQDELINLQERMHKTIVFISHDLDEALKLGDRIVLMKDGEIVQVGTPEEILTAPATEYVRRFVEDVDITKVLTAESVMKKIDAVAYIKTDGPRASLRKMRKNNISNLFVLNEKHKLIGMLNAADCAKLVEKDGKDIKDIMHTDLQAVDLDCPAQELFNIMQDRALPLPVISSERKLKGVIVRGTLIGALAERGGN